MFFLKKIYHLNQNSFTKIKKISSLLKIIFQQLFFSYFYKPKSKKIYSVLKTLLFVKFEYKNTYLTNIATPGLFFISGRSNKMYNTAFNIGIIISIGQD